MFVGVSDCQIEGQITMDPQSELVNIVVGDADQTVIYTLLGMSTKDPGRLRLCE